MKKFVQVVVLLAVITASGVYIYSQTQKPYTVAELQEQAQTLPEEKVLSNLMKTLKYYQKEVAKLPEGKVDDQLANTISAINNIVAEIESQPAK